MIDATIDALISGPITNFAPLGLGAVVESGDHLWWIEELGAAPRDLGAFGSLAGAVMIDQRRLIATSEGFFLFEEAEVQRSPLAVPGRPVDLIAAGSDLWISTDTSLFRWREDQLIEVRPELPRANARLGFDGAAVWAESGGFLYTVSADGAQLHLESPSIEALAIDGEGTLWIVESGKLLSRGASGVWSRVDFLPPVRAIAADFGLWIVTEEGVWRAELGLFHPTDVSSRGRLFASSADERLLDGGPEGLFRVRTGRAPEVIGLREGRVLFAPVTIEVRIAEPETATSVVITIDGVVTTSPVIDPAQLEDGAHVLKIVATYASGEAVRELGFATFRSRPPAWSTEIEPIFAEHCAMCHASGGVGRRLDAREHWIENIDRILTAVRDGRMPLPPRPHLSDAEIDRIDDWRAAGFGE